MSEKYYPTSVNFPYVILSTVERVLVYFAEMLYPTESYTDARKRILLSNFSDDASAIRRSIDQFKNSNGTFPFTAYSISDDEPILERSNLQKNGTFYSELVGAYVRYIPMNLSIPMVTFYTTPSDFWRAMTYFASDEADMTRLDVPITINDVLTYFVIDLEYTTERGDLAFDIESQFGYGKLYPVVHTVSVKGAYITIDIQKNSTTQVINKAMVVAHVDDIIFQLSQLEDAKHLEQNTLIETQHSPNTPSITSVPLNNATGVALISTIVLTFDVAMNEDSVYNNIDIVPYCAKDMSFDISSKILTIIPRDPLTASTEYEVLLNTSVQSGDYIPLEEDYSLIFTTGLV